MILLLLMGTSALVGAVAAIGVGTGIYVSYGRKRAEATFTPWRIIRSEIFDGDRYEKEKWWLVFNACTHPKNPDHLTLHEFTRALGILVPSIGPSQARSLFHEIDNNGDGMVDVVKFLDSMSSGIYESE